MAIVKKIYVYPIKSLAGIEREHIEISQTGLAYDRIYMLIDSQNIAITQREFAKLSLLICEINNKTLTVGNPAFGYLDIDMDISNGEPEIAVLFDKPIGVSTISDRYDQFFSTYLGIPCRLVKIKERSKLIEKYNTEISLQLQDGYPVHIVNEASVQFLEDNYGSPIDYLRFRPNIYVENLSAFEEEQYSIWKTVNGLSLQYIKPAGRCQIVNVNPITSISTKDILALLNQYKKQGNNVLFGAYCIVDQSGTLYVGDYFNVQ